MGKGGSLNVNIFLWSKWLGGGGGIINLSWECDKYYLLKTCTLELLGQVAMTSQLVRNYLGEGGEEPRGCGPPEGTGGKTWFTDFHWIPRERELAQVSRFPVFPASRFRILHWEAGSKTFRLLPDSHSALWRNDHFIDEETEALRSEDTATANKMKQDPILLSP